MKVFYSWQSDLPSKKNRFFIQKCLEKATKQLNADMMAAERPDELKVDHDTKGVPGTPDIVSTILGKIEQSEVFVGDVSIVGKNESRSLLNPNVAIELGYAMAVLGDSRVVLVMDSAQGEAKELPFDLSHKRHPITFNSHASDLKQEEQMLVATLKTAIQGCLRDLAMMRAGINTTFELFGPFSQNNYRLDVYALNEGKKAVTDYRLDLEIDAEILKETQPGYWSTDKKNTFVMTPANRSAVVPGGKQWSARGANDKIILGPGQSAKAGSIHLVGKLVGRKIAVKTSAPEVESQSVEFDLGSLKMKPPE